MNPDNFPPETLASIQGLIKAGMDAQTYDILTNKIMSTIGDPDLEGFDRAFSPDRPPGRAIKGRKADVFFFDELESVYGKENILSDEQIEASRVERKNRWLAKIRNRAWSEVTDMRRAWIERNRVYGAGTDFGVF